MKYTAEDKVIRTKIQLQKDKPFWARLILSLNITQAKDNELPPHAAAGIDAKGNLMYSEQFFDKLSEDGIKYILAHEVAHLMLGHMLRLNQRNPVKWNIACDLVINSMLNQDGFTAPNDGLIPDYNHSFKLNDQVIENLNNKSSEEVYDEIKDTKEQDQPTGFDSHKFEELSEQEKETIAKEWKQAAIDAANYAKLAGSKTGAFEKIITEMLDPKVNWKHILYKYIVDNIPHDYTFMRRSKKSLSTGIYMPMMKKENIEVVVHIDTSGSINQTMLTEFVTEIVSIARSFDNVHMTLIECDCSIKQVLEVSNGNIDKILNMKIKGGGGTAHQPLWKHVEENIPECKVLISLTDGYSDITENDEPGYDVIFTMPKDHQEISFGEMVMIE